MAKKHIVSLTDDDRIRLHRLLTGGTSRSPDQTRARILLKADQSASGPSWSGHSSTTSGTRRFGGFGKEPAEALTDQTVVHPVGGER